MSDVNANINISINSQQALGQLRALQNQISTFNQSVVAGNVAAVQAQRDMTRNLTAQINATKGFTTSISNVETSVSRLSTAIDKNKLSLREYFRYGIASSGVMGKSMREHADIMQLAGERVKRLQTQYIALEQAHNGYTRSLAVRPTNLFNADSAIAIQRQQIFNKLLGDGSTALVNWGKNTQWAGRQLMVGFTVPLTIFGGVAGKIFMDLEKQVVQFKRVYGDLQTPQSERNAMVEEVKELAKEFTKYGIAVSDTVALAAKAAATGAQGEDLMAATTEATRLATLGQIDYQQALDATISLQTALGISSGELAEATDFLNAVENQTVTSLDDITQAIPLVAPVVKGLGGDVKDLAIFMTAMREGGISANEGANALKSGLASLINPTRGAKEQLEKVGINIDSILSKNKGDLRGLVMEFGEALGTLGKFERQQTLAKMFGKYQFSRMGALFSNISKEGSQAARVMDLTAMSAQELGQIAEGELAQLEESVGVKFTAAVEKLKLAIAPIGEAFLKIATPIIDFAAKIADAFNNLPDAAKTFITWGTAIGGVLVPTIIMLVGLLGNFAGNMLKIGAAIGRLMGKTNGLSSGLEYLTMEELDAMAAAASLEGQTNSLTSAINVQRTAVNRLSSAYRNYVSAAGAAATNIPQGFGTPARKMARGGIVPGSGNGDTVPALLTPGESVITKEATEKYGPILEAMNSGKLPGFVQGGVDISAGGTSRRFSGDFFQQRSEGPTREYVQRIVSELVEDGMAIDDALNRIEIMFNDFAETGTKISKRAAEQYARDNELTRSSRTLVAAHLTSGSISQESPEYQSALSQTSQDFQRFHDVHSEYIRGVSKLTATLPSLLNQQLKVGLGFESFARQWDSAGDEVLFNAAQLMDSTILADDDAAGALRSMASEIRDRTIAIARNEGREIANDNDLAAATREVIDSHLRLGGSSRRAATALDNASREVGQFRTNVPRNVWWDSQNNRTRPGYEERGRSIVHVATGQEAARDRGARPAGNIGPGLATATQLQQETFSTEQLTRIMEGASRAGEMGGEELHDSFVEASGDMVGDSITKYTSSPHPKAPIQGTMDGKPYGENFVAAAQAAMQKAGQKTGETLTPFGVMDDIKAQQEARKEAMQRKVEESKINKEISRRAMLLQRQGIPAQAALRMAKEELATEKELLRTEQQREMVGGQGDRAAARRARGEGPSSAQGPTSAGVRPRRAGGPVVPDIGKEASSLKGGMKKFGDSLMRGSAKMTGAMFALDGLVFGLSMMDNQLGEMAQQLMPGVFGIQAITMMLPMLTSPIGIAAAAFAALGIGLWKVNENVNEIRSNAKKMNEAMFNTTKSLEDTASFYNRDLITKKSQAKSLGTTEKQLTQGQEYLKTDAGKIMTEGFSMAMSKMGNDVAVKQFATKLGSMVMQGAMSPKEARAVADALETELGIKGLSAKIKGKLTSLIGKDGKDITKEPMTVAVKLQVQNQEFLDATKVGLDSIMKMPSIQENLQGGGTLFGGELSDTQGLSGFARNFKAMFDPEWAALIAAANGYGSAVSAVAKDGYATLNAATERYKTLQKEANKEDDPKKKRELNKELREQAKALRELKKGMKEYQAGVEETFSSQLPGVQDEMLLGMEDSLKSQFEGTPEAAALEAFLGSTKEVGDKTARFNIETAIASGELSPSVVAGLLTNIENEETAVATIDMMLEQGGSISETEQKMIDILSIKNDALRKKAILVLETESNVKAGKEDVLGNEDIFAGTAREKVPAAEKTAIINGAKERMEIAARAKREWEEQNPPPKPPEENASMIAAVTEELRNAEVAQEIAYEANQRGAVGMDGTTEEIERWITSQDNYVEATNAVTAAKERLAELEKEAASNSSEYNAWLEKQSALQREVDAATKAYNASIADTGERMTGLQRLSFDKIYGTAAERSETITDFIVMKDKIEELSGQELSFNTDGKSLEEINEMTEVYGKLSKLPKRLLRKIDVDSAAANTNIEDFDIKWNELENTQESISKILKMDKSDFDAGLEAAGISYAEFAALPNLQKTLVMTYMTAYLSAVERFDSAKEMLDAQGEIQARSGGEVGIPTGAVKNAGKEYQAAQENLEKVENDLQDSAKDYPKGGEEVPKKDPKGTGPSGGSDGSGGGDKEDPLAGYKDMWKNIQDQLKMYTNLEKVMKKLKGKKKTLENAMNRGAFGFDNSLVQNMRKAGLSETFISDLLSKGYDEAKKIFKTLKKRDKLAVANRAFLVGGAGLTVSENRRAAREADAQVKANQRLSGINEEARNSIASDPAKAQQFNQLWIDAQNGIAGADKRLKDFINSEVVAAEKAEALQNALDPQALLDESISLIDQSFSILEDQINRTYDKLIEPLQDQITANEDIIDLYEKQIDVKQEQIDDQERLNELDQQAIEDYNRDIEMQNRKIEGLRREDEIRQRAADALQRELDLMSRAEQTIREAYQKRISALDTVSKLNDRILQSQQDQLNIGKALSEGDVYAAAQAAAEMQRNSMQYAAEQNRAALEQGMENQVAGLRTSSGLSRVQAEAQIQAIQDQSYQTQLAIRDIEDYIYNLKETKILPLEDAIYARNLTIRDLQNEIYDINENSIEPLEIKNKDLEDQIKSQERLRDLALEEMVIGEFTRDAWEQRKNELNMATVQAELNALALNSIAEKYRDIAEAARAAAAEIAKVPGASAPAAATGSATGTAGTQSWQATWDAAAAANQATLAAIRRKSNGGMIQKYAVGSVVGTGARDSVAAMLTPGEYVIRKSMVDKYGLPLFEDINQGSFTMPRYGRFGKQVASIASTGKTNVDATIAPVYNTYSVNVNASTNASPDDIANTVINKIRSIDSMSIRRVNGY